MRASGSLTFVFLCASLVGSAIAYASTGPLDYQGIALGTPRAKIEEARTIVRCDPDERLDNVEYCALNPFDDEATVWAFFMDDVLFQLEVEYRPTMKRKHDLVAAQLSKKLGVKPKRDEYVDERQRLYNRSTFRRAGQRAVLTSLDYATVGRAYGVAGIKSRPRYQSNYGGLHALAVTPRFRFSAVPGQNAV